MSVLVSIVIPVYNSEEFLLETIDSVKKQTIEDYEIIVVDNCSTNAETIKVINNLPDDIIKVKSKEKGLSAARNDGIHVAKGKYILPLDSDDLLSPNFLERFVAEFEKVPSLSLVRCNIRLFGKKTGVVNFDSYSFEKLLARNLMVATSMFKRDDWERVGGYDKNLTTCFEDWEFWIRLLKEDGKVATIQDPLFSYRIRKTSMMHSLKVKQLKEPRKYIWMKHKKLYAQFFVDPTETFEYKLIHDSLAYKLGKKISSPFSFLKLIKDE